MQSDNRLVWVLAFLLLALLLSALANVYFLRLGRHFFRELSLARLDPSASPKLIRPMTAVWLPRRKSRWCLWAIHAPPPGLRQSALPGFVFINRGVNGHTAVQTQQRFDQHVTPLQPDIVVIQVGINDLHSNCRPGRRQSGHHSHLPGEPAGAGSAKPGRRSHRHPDDHHSGGGTDPGRPINLVC
jgi:hypothetical protein